MNACKFTRGQSLFEAIIALMLFAIAATVLMTAVAGGGDGVTSASLYSQGAALADEGIEAVRSIHDGAWNELKYPQSQIAVSGGQWIFNGNTAPETIGKFTRTIAADPVCRDGTGAITVCPGTYTDAYMKQVTVTVSWQARPGTTSSVKRIAYLTDWDSRDWLEDTTLDFADGTFSGTAASSTAGDANGAIVLPSAP
jgi:type II secretory pathway pseudopilin PulG